mmetsp:Transcript_25855/g.22781  ORF Transcript_25855/g.22781 Transcript_25855/m.22781 type:complete len:154 (+) Transcript_25855:40-501(+)
MQTSPVSIFIACTKKGLNLKADIIKHLEAAKRTFVDLGVKDENDNSDHIDVCKILAEKVQSQSPSFGFIITGHGSDAVMIMNKFKGIRCAQCVDYYTAQMSRRHNNANCLAFAQDQIGNEVATQGLDAFLSEPFSGGKHETRVGMITEKEKKD